MSNLFNAMAYKIQNDKTMDLTLFIFQPTMKYGYEIIESLYQQQLKKNPTLPNNAVGIRIDNLDLYRNKEVVELNSPVHPILTITSITEEAYGVYSFHKEIRQTIRFVQQWLSIVFNNVGDVYQASNREFNQLPPVLINALINSKHLLIENYQYSIPKGKEDLWHKIEEILKYYLGFSLLV